MINLSDDLKKTGVLLVISGPSGVGKGTIVSKLLLKDPVFCLSVSATTRNPREGELDGRDYNFFSREKFESMIKNGDFLEYAEYCGNYYGTLLSEVEKNLSSGRCLILEIEIVGYLKLKKKFPNHKIQYIKSIFIKPPSFDELENRLKKRGKDDDETIKKRILKAEKELAFANKYDLVITNESSDVCVKEICNYLSNLKPMKIN